MAHKSYTDLKRKGVYIVKNILKRATPKMAISLISGQDSVELPLNSGKVVNFVRFERLALGVTLPEVSNNLGGTALGYTDIATTQYEVTLQKVGAHVILSKDSINFAEDMVDQRAVELLEDQFAQTMETRDFNILKTCPQQFFANKVAGESTVNKKVSVADLRRVTAFLNKNDALKISQVTSSTINFGTEATKDAFFALYHPDLDADLYDLSGFKGIETYGAQKYFEMESGQHEHIRFLKSTIYDKYTLNSDGVNGTGATVGDGSVEVGANGKAFVYPIVVVARGAFNKVSPKGMGALKVNIGSGGVSNVNPYDDSVVFSWTTYTALCITNEKFIATLNVARGTF